MDGESCGRRVHCEKACDYVAKNRNLAYKNINFDHLIPLPFYLTVHQLSTVDDTSKIIENIFNAYTVNGGNLCHDWMKYCKNLTNEDDQAQAILEGAVYFARKRFPLSDRREEWASSTLRNFHSLKLGAVCDEEQTSTNEPSTNQPNNPHNDGPGTAAPSAECQPQNIHFGTQVAMKHKDNQMRATLNTLSPTKKSSPPSLENQEERASTSDFKPGVIGNRKRTYTEESNLNLYAQVNQGNSPHNDGPDTALLSVTFQPHNIRPGTQAALMADFNGLGKFLGSFLHHGVKSSPPRLSELKRGIVTFTGAVRLYIPRTEGHDCIVELLLDSTTGQSILQLNNSVDNIRFVLGDYFFYGMMESKLKQNEILSSVTSSQAVRLIYCDGFYCKLEVTICFQRGIDMFISVYPPNK